MATNAIAGLRGIIKASSSTTGAILTIAELRDWTVSAEMDALDATSKDSSGAREFIAGLSQWTATANHLYAATTNQTFLFDVLTGRTKISIEFYPTATSSGFPTWSGSAFVTGWELGAPEEDVSAVDVEFQGTAVLTRATSS